MDDLHLLLGEAKNLPTYPGPNKMRDCYCTVNLDQEEVFRTKVVEKSLCPFYGEDFYCEIPRSFRHLSFYIFDRDVFRRDSIIGKVAIQKEDLQKYHNRDTWFQLQHVDADSEVQGKVHLELRLSEVITDSGVVCHKLATRILECQGLPIVNGQCDPYATVTLAGPCRSEAKKTKVKKKTNNPQFDEVFYFEVTRPCSYSRKSHFDFEDEDVDKLEIRVDLWNASNLKFGDEFLGELRVPLKVLRQSSPHEAWYFLQPRDNGSKSLKPGDLGSLRLNVVYTEDHVFSSDYYSPLRDLLLKSADVEVPGAGGTPHSLDTSLSMLFSRDPNTIFRGNSLTSKCIDETMKLAGMQYLHVTLKPTIEEICQSHKSCEIDPVRLKDGESLESNMENLRQFVDRVFSVITKSGVSCPTVMCDIFFSLREAAAKRFQDDLDVRYTAVSSFIFLRFFAPAILSPNLFQLTPHHTDPQTSRTLTLVSKTIQTLGSLSKSKSVIFKESYMAAFYEFFNEQKYADAVKNFLDLISSSGRRDPKSVQQPILLKEGASRAAWALVCGSETPQGCSPVLCCPLRLRGEECPSVGREREETERPRVVRGFCPVAPSPESKGPLPSISPPAEASPAGAQSTGRSPEAAGFLLSLPPEHACGVGPTATLALGAPLVHVFRAGGGAPCWSSGRPELSATRNLRLTVDTSTGLNFSKVEAFIF
uniref:Ras GTPase-activating protein 3 n=1 Tax=Bos taurus TaxID=9913 RepID=A0A3Q1N891_BOVIN